MTVEFDLGDEESSDVRTDESSIVDSDKSQNIDCVQSLRSEAQALRNDAESVIGRDWLANWEDLDRECKERYRL